VTGVVAAASLVLSACSGGGGATTSTTTTTVSPAAAAAAAAAAGGCAPFRGVTTKLQSRGPTSSSFLVDATAGVAGCLDRVTFTFDNGGIVDSAGAAPPPGYVVAYRDPAKTPFLDGDPPTAIDLPGSAFLDVTMSPALSTNPLVDGRPQTYTGNLSLEYGDHHHLMVVRKLPDQQQPGHPPSVEWIIGLDQRRPFIVDRASDPPRVTVYIG
jgi:hypothetical protein